MKNIKTITFALILMISFDSIAQEVSVIYESDILKYEKLNQPKVCNGLIVLFTYTGGNGNTDIPIVAEKDSILVINIQDRTETPWLVSINDAEKFDTCIRHAMITNKIPKGEMIIGGFSGGGTCATRYTEWIIERDKSDLMPKGLFLGDAPLDYIEFYKYCEREIVRGCPTQYAKIGKQESTSVKNDFNKAYGNLDENRADYIKNSPVTISEPDLGNAKYLLRLPVRTYHEVDPMWYIKNSCRNQFTEENIYVGSALINYLYNNGNQDAEIIITHNKGYRNSGFRHPHSWSIIDATDLIKWFKSIND